MSNNSAAQANSAMQELAAVTGADIGSLRLIMPDDKLQDAIVSFTSNLTVCLKSLRETVDKIAQTSQSKSPQYAVQYDHDASFHFAGDLSVFKELNGFMTGQEWYDAYKRELGFGSFDDVKSMAAGDKLKGIEVTEMKCDEAAKRASGLEKGL